MRRDIEELEKEMRKMRKEIRELRKEVEKRDDFILKMFGEYKNAFVTKRDERKHRNRGSPSLLGEEATISAEYDDHDDGYY